MKHKVIPLRPGIDCFGDKSLLSVENRPSVTEHYSCYAGHHERFLLDEKEREVRCDKCNAKVEAFDALMQITKEYERFRENKLMGYTVLIGNAVPARVNRNTHQYEWTVKRIKCRDAPESPAEGLGRANEAWPSYSWPDFCKKHGLHELFYDDDVGLFRPHPGCALLRRRHAVTFEKALKSFRKQHPDAVAGYERELPGESYSEFISRITTNPTVGPHSGALARLEWFAWWVRWAVEKCERPAMENR